MNQRGDASGNSTIIQSGSDTNIGFSAHDVKGIIASLADQMPKYAAMAAEIVESRLQTFEEKILQRFAQESEANAQAFSLPDFQYSVAQAQRVYCRFGEEVNVDLLINLLVQRSKEAVRTRLALSLSQAIERSTLLTDNEIAAISLSYLITYTHFQTVESLTDLGGLLQKFVGPLLPDITAEESSYGYLEAHGCGTMIMMEGRSLIQVLHKGYAGLFSLGHSTQRIEELFGPQYQDFMPLVIPCKNFPGKWQANAINAEILEKRVIESGFSDQLSQFMVLIEPASLMNQEQAVQALSPEFPGIAKLFEAWDETMLKRLRLNPVGFAIAYANVQRLTKHDSDLSIWIQ